MELSPFVCHERRLLFLPKKAWLGVNEDPIPLIDRRFIDLLIDC